jgi:hypothetical protein
MEQDIEKPVKSAKHLFQKGDDPRRNLKGRSKGTRDFATDFDEVVEEIAKEEGITKSQARKDLLKVAYKHAKTGDYNFYRDIHDRVYGKPLQPTDLTSGGKELPTPIYAGQSIQVQGHDSDKEDIQTEEKN